MNTNAPLKNAKMKFYNIFAYLEVVAHGRRSQMWNSTIQANITREVNTARTTALMNLPVPMDRTPSAVLNLPGAQIAIDSAKNAVDQSISTINRKITEVKAAGDAIVNEQGRMRSAIETRRRDSENYTKSVSEAQVLANIRKEQAEALKQKYGANYHTSWLGLWRPLSDQSRVGLLIAGIAFSIVAVFSLVYYFWEKLPAFSGGFTKPYESQNYGSVGFGESLIGGFMRRSRK